ncbi:MAG: hypothetical protein AB1756_00160 [Acidobacteriota bacterium]
MLSHSHDTSFLYFLLEPMERTFSYAHSSKEHPVLRDLGEWGKKAVAFYAKPVSEDRPLRIEFMGAPDKRDSIASTVCSLSRLSKSYAYPAVFIEADLRAALDRIELERAYRQLLGQVGFRSSIMKLRRDSRPFR